nr:bromodomain containing protein 8 [Hymenolepis microstoma]
MPYGRPVSRKRRRRFQNGESRGTPWAAIAARKAAAAAAAAETGSNPDSDGAAGSNPSPETRKGMTSGSVVIGPSLDLLRPGYSTGVWPLRERLLLASSLLDTDNRQLTWPPISRRLFKFTPPPPSCGGNARPPTWCSAKACAKQYSLLLESAEMFKKQQIDVEKSAEEGRTVYQAPGDVAAITATVGLSLPEFIVKRLTVERIEELRSNVLEAREKHSLLKSMLERVKSGELDYCMDDIWAEIQRQEIMKCQPSEHHQPPKPTPTTSSETADIKPEILSPNSLSVEQSENQLSATAEEVFQFVNDLNSWQDPYDVPPSVWTVSGGLGANLRSVQSVSKVPTAPRRPGAVGRPRKRPLHPVRADLSNRLSMKSPKQSLAASEAEIGEDESTSEAAEEGNESDASSTSLTECMASSDAETLPVMSESLLRQERRRQQEVIKLIKHSEDVVMPRLTSPKRKSTPTSPVRTSGKESNVIDQDVLQQRERQNEVAMKMSDDDVPLSRLTTEANGETRLSNSPKALKELKHREELVVKMSDDDEDDVVLARLSEEIKGRFHSTGISIVPNQETRAEEMRQEVVMPLRDGVENAVPPARLSKEVKERAHSTNLTNRLAKTNDSEKWPNMIGEYVVDGHKHQLEVEMIETCVSARSPSSFMLYYYSDTVFVSPSRDSSTEGMNITNNEEWPIMPEAFISAERKRQPKVRNITKIEGNHDIQLLSPPPGEESTILSPPHLAEEEETAPLADLAVKVKRSARRHSQSSQKERKPDDSRIKRKLTEMPAFIPEEEVSKKQEVSGSSTKDKKKREDGEKKINKSKKEHSLKEHTVEDLKVTEPKVEEQLQQHGVGEEKMEVNGQEDAFKPRSLRLRLSRQDDGNLTVVDEKPTPPTQAQPAPKSPIKLRLSLSPIKLPETPTSCMTTEALAAAFPNIKLDPSDEISPPLKKKSRTSNNKPTEKELFLKAKSILSSAEAKAKKEVGKSASPQNIKRHFVHRVLKELSKRVLNEASTSGTISTNFAQEVYNQLEPVLTNWVKECGEMHSEKSSQSSARKLKRK